MIVARQESEGWGKSIVKRLSSDLQTEFPGVGGFSTQNLWYMRQFYQEYRESPKLQPLVGEIGWSHKLIVMGRCHDALEREFYLRMTRKFGWSKNILIHQIDGLLHFFSDHCQCYPVVSFFRARRMVSTKGMKMLRTLRMNNPDVIGRWKMSSMLS
jgi:predicted nuclease of restriction endonuclease-like (RecB) superfamily